MSHNEEMQKKAFVAWTNLHLKTVNESVEDLKTDFASGIKLIKLIEVISEDSLGKYNKKPISKFAKVENLNIAMNFINGFLKEQKITNQYSAENVLEENETLILGMVYTLVLRFAVQEITEGDRTAKEGLLLWAQKKVDEATKGKVQIANFHTSWQDGSAFCAVIQAFRPDLITQSVVPGGDNANKIKNLNLAFEVAEEHLGIPKMLDANDMVSHRPDEKSVMTYVSLFWKQFASNKKKALAAERIGKIVLREQQFVEQQAQYEALAASLGAWLRDMQTTFAAGTSAAKGDELQSQLESFIEYRRAERPGKIAEMMEAEAVLSSISSKMDALGRSYEPPEELALSRLQRWWEELTLAEEQYEASIKTSLRTVKKMSGLIKIFNSKASKLDQWLGSKAAWLQASHDAANEKLGKPLAAVEIRRITSGPISPGDGDSMRSEDGFERLQDPTLAPSNLSPTNRAKRVQSSPAKPSFDPGPQEDMPRSPRSSFSGMPGGGLRSPRSSFSAGKPSLFGDLFAAINDTFTTADTTESGRESTREEEEAETMPPPAPLPAPVETPPQPKMAAREATPSKASAPVLQSQKSMQAFAEELPLETSRAQADGSLDSVSAVLAKLNLFKAYEEEQASRQLTLTKLAKLLDELKAVGCTPPVLSRLENRQATLTEASGALATAAAAYRADLDEVLAMHKALDEKRLDFARRAEALNRWIEEAHDELSEALNIETPKDADLATSGIEAVRTEESSQKGECESLKAFYNEMVLQGARSNPYSRFTPDDLETALARIAGAIEERAGRIEEERMRLSEVDEAKRRFASEAEKVLAFITAERAAVDAKAAEGRTIQPDDAESIQIGHMKLTWLNEYAGKADERLTQLDEAQEISDELMAAAELDNPFTKESMATVKAAAAKLEKRVRDLINLVDGQLARAVVSITVEQQQELREAFTHFDKSGDGHLNDFEFTAAMKSMDMEDVDFDKYADTTALDTLTGQKVKAISFDSFLTLVLQQFKDKDTSDGLASAFRALADGKDALSASVLDKTLKPNEAAFLKEKLAPAEGGAADSYDYMPFSAAVYGAGSATPVS